MRRSSRSPSIYFCPPCTGRKTDSRKKREHTGFTRPEKPGFCPWSAGLRGLVWVLFGFALAAFPLRFVVLPLPLLFFSGWLPKHTLGRLRCGRLCTFWVPLRCLAPSHLAFRPLYRSTAFDEESIVLAKASPPCTLCGAVYCAAHLSPDPTLRKIQNREAVPYSRIHADDPGFRPCLVPCCDRGLYCTVHKTAPFLVLVFLVSWSCSCL